MHPNIPEVKLGIVGVSRDCFPRTLSESRRAAVLAACAKRGIPVTDIPVTVENEADAKRAVEALKSAGCNAVCVYLGNFGPEGPETLVAKLFDGPAMFAAAAEETGENLINGRGDAYCGLLNASYNLRLRGLNAYIPESPVGAADEVADMLADFIPVARILLGVKNLKLFAFGPRPYDFLACNAPIEPLYRLGLTVQENSELDLLVAYKKHANDPRIPGVVADMKAEMGSGAGADSILLRLAQYEITLEDWMRDNLGASEYAVFANKCWPAFQTEFGFVPCYVNGRFAKRMIPIACETDMYGALSEYMICCALGTPPAILDINNTVPADMWEKEIKGRYPYKLRETFMGFHCGNASACLMQQPQMKYQLIMKRALEPDGEPDITRGTLEGDLQPGEITFFRLQSSADCKLRSYVAQGEILPVATRSFGSIGVFGIPEMGRFYRHVLVGKNYPHHGAVAFASIGRALWDAVRMMGVDEIDFNRPAGMLYPGENPFASR